MRHISANGKTETTTPPTWLPVGAGIGDLVNEWADRSDLVTYIGHQAGVGQGVAALFIPGSAEIHLNIDSAFGSATPEQVGDMRERMQQFEYPKASGALLHEAMHARFSTMDLRKLSEDLSPNAYEAFNILEESRIEFRAVSLFPQNRALLRACALELAIGDVEGKKSEETSTVRQAGLLAGISLARIDAGVLKEEDIEAVSDLINTVLPGTLIASLREIWVEFQQLTPETHLDRMYELANEWERLLNEESESRGEEDRESAEEFAKSVLEALADSASISAIGARIEADEQQAREEYSAQASAAQSRSREKAANKKTAEATFNSQESPDERRTNSELKERRSPTPTERASAVRISQWLEKAKYNDRIEIETASELPPGRLRTSALVQGQAYKDRGLMMRTRPFERVARRHADDPNLTIGVMVDISGSMSDAMQPMASAAWILSEATRRVQGKVAMVYYGSDVFATLKPGQHLSSVDVYSASDFTEEFDKAFRALDGSLDLLDGSGARLLVVVSDGRYRTDQEESADSWIKRCAQAGVGVLWIGAGYHADYASRYVNGQDSQFIRMKRDATSVADEIGKTASVALTKAGQTRRS